MANIINYLPASIDFNHPTDRRGVMMFCSRKKQFKIKPIYNKLKINNKSQIIVFITPKNTDLISRLINEFENNKSYKKKKLICIYLDFYHGYSSSLYNYFSTLYRRIIYNRENNFLEVSYKLMSLANVLILGSNFQRDMLLNLYPHFQHKEITVIPDYIEEIFQKKRKNKNYFEIQKTFSEIKSGEKKLNILWEGIGYGALIPLLKLVLCSFVLKRKKIYSRIYFLTDPKISAYSRLTIPTKLVVYILKLIGTDIKYKRWSKENLVEFSQKSNLSIITVNNLHPATKYKPANKIRLMLSLGLDIVLCPELKDYLRFKKRYKGVISYSSVFDCSNILLNMISNPSLIKKMSNESKKIFFDSYSYNSELDEIWSEVLSAKQF